MIVDQLEPPDDAFTLLGFYPNCAVQTEAAQALGYKDMAAAVQHGHADEMPEACGQCPQERFLADFDEPNTDLFYGGSAAGGKSIGMLMGALRACRRFPGLQAFWFRESFPNLSRTVIRTLERYGFARALGARWNNTSYELRFANGSLLTFCYVQSAQQAQDFLSAEMNLLLLDERTQLPPDAVNLLYSRVRSGVAGVPNLGIRSASNPGGIGHDVVKRGYIDATAYGDEAIIDDSGRLRRFIRARLTDTPQVDPDEYADSLSGLGPDMARKFLEGDWDIAEGAVFSEWRYDRHVVAPFLVPLTWRRVVGIDWGWSAPWAVIWIAVDPDGRLWLYRELYATKVVEREQARRILEVEAEAGEYQNYRVMDPACWAQTGEALPVASQYLAEGCAVTRASNDRRSGWSRLHQYLAEGPACLHHRQMGWETCPMLHVQSHLREWLRTVPNLPRDPRNVEDVLTTAEDHLADSSRYACMSPLVSAAPFFIRH